MTSSLLELAYWCQLDSLLNIFRLASTTGTQYTSNHLQLARQLLSDPADVIFKNPTNSASWNFQYKAFAQNAFHKNLIGQYLVVVTPIYKKLGTIRLLIMWGVHKFCHRLCTLMCFVHYECLLADKIVFILAFCLFYGNYLYLAFTFLKKPGITSSFWEEWSLPQLCKLKYL